MDPETGGLSSAERQRQTAAAIARKKVLAAYSSHAAPSRHLPVTAKDILVKDRPRTTEPHPIAASAATASNTKPAAPAADPATSHPTAVQPATSQPTTDQAPVLKDAPINTAKVSAEWQKYHSAWQNYYQNYYNNYYSKAAENYLATAKMKDERIATGQARKRRTSSNTTASFSPRLWPTSSPTPAPSPPAWKRLTPPSIKPSPLILA